MVTWKSYDWMLHSYPELYCNKMLTHDKLSVFISYDKQYYMYNYD